jgi:hypothetical protein
LDPSGGGNKDEHFGFFQGSFGFEVVIDNGDYLQSKSDSGFELDIDFLKANECILNITGDNATGITGNRVISGVNMVNEKIFRENIYKFIDPAAFYGAHISSLDITRKKELSSNITYFDNDSKDSCYLPVQVYNNIVSKFSTKNKIYLYVQSFRGRSLDFINDFNPTNEHGNEVDFLKSYSWPIKIFSSSSLNLKLNRSNYWKDVSDYITTPQNSLFYNINFSLKSPLFSKARFFIEDCYNKKSLVIQKDNTLQIDIKLRKPACILGSIAGGISNIDTDPDIKIISNLIFIYHDIKTQNTYKNNNLVGPVNLEKIFEPNDFENSNQVIQTVVYKKPKFNFNNESTLNEMLVLYDEASSTIADHTRMYFVYPIESIDPNFVKGKEVVANYTIENDVNKLFNNNNVRLGDGLRFWKNQKIVGGNAITYLTISGFGEDYNNIEQSLMIGVTKAQVNSLMNGNLESKFNVYFHFQGIDFVDGFFKAELGIQYEDNMGLLKTFFPSEKIYVYSADRKIFTTNEFANKFALYSELAKVTVDFLPKQNWKGSIDGIGEYGIDWMRAQPLNPPTNIYPPFKEISGLINGQTNSNEYEGPNISFQQNPEMYNRLKNEIYGAIPIPWGMAPNDEYFTSWVRLNKTDEVELKLKINVNTTPQELKIKYEGNFYEIKVFNGTTQVGTDRILPNNIKEYIIPNALLISGSTIDNLTFKIKRINLTSNNTINDVNRKIEVLALETVNGQIKENIAGMLKLYQEPDITLNIQFVKVKFINPNGNIEKLNSDTVLDKQKDYLKKYLKQAGIEAKIADGLYPEINVSTDPNFQPGGHYMVNIGSTYYIRGYYEPNTSSNIPAGYLPIKKYLKSLLTTPINENTMIVYFINNLAKKQNIDTGAILPAGTLSLGGFSNGDDSDTINFIAESDPFYIEDYSTIAHEVYHSLGLGHTFDNAQRFVFQAKKTDNIMDYTHLDYSLSTPSTYYWQWLIARQNAKQWKRKSSTEG